MNQFAYWVEDNCGYVISEEDMPALEESLDGTHDHRLNKDGFIECVSVAAAVEEEEEGDDDENKHLDQEWVIN